MKPTVYVDTTIPSYYVDERPALRLHVERTRQWWDGERDQYDVYISDFVVLELQEGEYPRQADAVQLVQSVPRLAHDPQISAIVDAYLAHRLMPRRDVRDALQLAFASDYKVEHAALMALERLVVGRVPLPMGTSLLAVSSATTAR
jgi:predicted nucleic acid-binding protein